MFAAITSLTVLDLICGWLLGLAARYLKVEVTHWSNRWRPCCRTFNVANAASPAAARLAQADSGRPGPVTPCLAGDCALTEELAGLLGIGIDLSVVVDKVPVVAHAHEQLCIGCTKCFKRCPTDPILGGPRMIHIEMCLIGATLPDLVLAATSTG